MKKTFALPLALLCACRLAVADPSTNQSATNTSATTTAPAATLSILPAEKLLPDDTLAMFTVPDFSKARDFYLNSPQGRLWNDPAMKDFKDKFIAQMSSGFIAPLEHELGIRFSDYSSLPQGQLTFAMIQNDWKGKDGQPALLLLLDVKDKTAQLKTNLDDLKKKWINAGKTIRTEKIRDVDFSVVVVSKADFIKAKKPGPMGPGLPEPMPIDAKDMPKWTVYVGQAGSLLIVGDSGKVIEKVLARMSGGSVNVLNDLAEFDADRALFHDAPAYGWVNTKSLTDIFVRSSETTDADAESNPFAFKADKILAGLGLNALKSVGFNCRFSNDGSEFNVMLSVPESRRAGLLKIIAGEPNNCNPPAFVPADVVKFQRWRFDGQKTWATLRKSIGDIFPAAIGVMDLTLNTIEADAKEKDPSFNLNKNLFGNLGGDIVTYEKLPKGGVAGSAPSIVLIGSPNPEQFADAMKRIFSVYSPQAGTPAEREFLGHKIYTITLPARPEPGSSTPPTARSLSYTCSSGYMAISTDGTMLEEYLRSAENPPKALRDTPGLTDATQKVVTSGTSLFGYSNERESMRVRIEAMRNSSNPTDPAAGFAPLLLMMGMNDVKGRDWMDPALLPPFEKISKYFYFTVYSGSTTPEAINFKIFVPMPPELKK